MLYFVCTYCWTKVPKAELGAHEKTCVGHIQDKERMSQKRGQCQIPSVCTMPERSEELELLRECERKLRLEKVAADRLYDHLFESLRRSPGASSDTETQSLMRDWERAKVRAEL